jgi:death-on-curing protein
VSVYLSIEQVIEINGRMVDLYGGLRGVRDQGALQAAVARPQTGYYSDAIEEAAALFESLSQNHPFLDGNKRTAITATIVFLACNGYRVSFNDVEAYEWLMALYATGRVAKNVIEAWLRQHSEVG